MMLKMPYNADADYREVCKRMSFETFVTRYFEEIKDKWPWRDLELKYTPTIAMPWPKKF
jgi:hypothetical protein